MINEVEVSAAAMIELFSSIIYQKIYSIYQVIGFKELFLTYYEQGAKINEN